MLSKKEQKYIQSLKIKKYRSREKRFLVEGEKNVLEFLSSDYEIDLILSTEEFSSRLSEVSGERRVELISGKLLSQLGNFKTNETCLAVVLQKELANAAKQEDDHLFILDGIGDPGNLGTIIRTLDWFGYNELICSPDCAEFYHPKTIASTMGSFTRVDVQYRDLVAYLQGVDAPVYGADMKGLNLFKTSFDTPSIIVMGSESHGISPEVQGQLTNQVSIPKVGNTESLNVGVATGIIAGYLRNAR